jgi:hypothetical protein
VSELVMKISLELLEEISFREIELVGELSL